MIYPPSEDSWLLEKAVLAESLEGKKCMDLGTGSGIQAITMLKAKAASVLAVDINPEAVQFARKKVKEFLNGKKAKFRARQSDLFSKIGKEKFDFIAFNPPYVPSKGIKIIEDDGGKNGREVIDKFLKEFSRHLAIDGTVLLLVSSLNRPKEIERLLKKQGLECLIAQRQGLFFEGLLVLKISRNCKAAKQAAAH